MCKTDSFNAQTCQGFLVQLHRTSRSRGRRTVVIADNAKYHHAKLHEPWRQDQAQRLHML